MRQKLHSKIMHLRLEENLLALIPALDTRAGAEGNIAPDSGIPDEKWENFTQPPEFTHFNRYPEPELLAGLEF